MQATSHVIFGKLMLYEVSCAFWREFEMGKKRDSIFFWCLSCQKWQTEAGLVLLKAKAALPSWLSRANRHGTRSSGWEDAGQETQRRKKKPRAGIHNGASEKKSSCSADDSASIFGKGLRSYSVAGAHDWWLERSSKGSHEGVSGHHSKSCLNPWVATKSRKNFRNDLKFVARKIIVLNSWEYTIR